MDDIVTAIRPALAADGSSAETLLRETGLPLAGFRDHLDNALVALRDDELVGAKRTSGRSIIAASDYRVDFSPFPASNSTQRSGNPPCR